MTKICLILASILLLCSAPPGLALSTDDITGAIQGAIDDLAGQARALAESAACNFITNTLSGFGDVSTDPVMLSVDPSSTVGLFDVFPVPGASSIVIPLDSVTFDCSSRSLEVVSRPYGSQTIVPDVMELANIAFALAVDLGDASSLVVTFGGQWTVGGVTVDVQVVYTRSTGQVDITATPSGVSIDLIMLASDVTGLDVPNPFGDALTFTSFVLSGTILSDKTITVSLKLTSQVNRVYLIYHKPSQSAGQRMVAVDFANFQFSSLISEATGVDISGVPYFGSLTTPEIGLTNSRVDIAGLPGDTFADSPLLDLLTESGASVPAGTWAALNFDFFDSPIKFRFQGSLNFSPLGSGLSVNTLLSAIPGVDFSAIPLPFDIGIINNIDITSFTLANDLKRSVCIEVGYDNGLGFFNDQIQITSATINLCLSRQPTRVRAEVSGDLSIGGSSFSVALRLDDNDNYFIEASADSLPISNAVSQFQASILPSELNSVLSSIPFVSFSLRNPRLVYPFSSVPQQIQIGGTPVIAGYQTITVDVLIIREQSGTSLVEGFDIGAVNLADLIKSVTTFDVSSIAMLNQDLEAAIVISPRTLPDVSLHGPKLENFAITRGVSLQAEMSFPSDCSSDPFCAVAQGLLGASARLSIRGTMTSATRFALFAGVSDITVGGGLIIQDAGLEVEAGTAPTIGVTGTIVLTNPPITLTSRIFLSTSGVVLSLSQSGCWDSAFGVNWLSICSILGSIGLAPGILVSRLEIGGQVKLGDPSCSTPINAIGFLGIDAITPTNNYYYVEFVGETTVSSLMSAFCISLSLPQPLAESGFPNGFLSSFSLAGQELPHAGISIPSGYRLKGTLNILGLVGSADVTISLPDGIDFNVALPVIDVGNGLLRMSVSANDLSTGPFLRANIVLLPSPSVDIEASGYLRVLGISVQTTLRITNTQYEFSFSGNMLNLFEANLFVSAAYGSLSQASFRVRGSFQNNLYDQIEAKVKQVLQDSANAATSAINSAQAEVNSAQAEFDRANAELARAQDAVNSANAEFNSAEASLRSARDDVNSLCSIQSCGSVCVGCPTCCDCCGRVWGSCVCRVPGWDSCCTRVTDPTCLAANGVCEGLRATAFAALTAAEATVNTAQNSLTVAEGALTAAQGVVDAASHSLTVANAALAAAQATYQVGTDVAGRIASFGLNGLVSIREISFDVDLSAASGGSFAGSVRANFLGQAEVTVSLNINLRDITSMAKQIAEEIGDGFSSLF